MAKENGVKIEKTPLEKALDGALEDLQKATGTDLTKSEKKDEDDDNKGGEKDDEDESLRSQEESHQEGSGKKGKQAPWAGAAGKGDGDEKKSGKGSAQESQDEKGDESEDDEKAKKDGYRKSVQDDLSKSEAVKNAVEVSKFLGEIVKSLGEIVGDLRLSNSNLSKRIASLEKSQKATGEAIVGAFSAQGEITKSFAAEIATFGGRPLPRKAVNAAKVEVLAKSGRGDEEATGAHGDLTKSQIADKLADLEMTNKIPVGSTSRFEAAGLMSKSVEGLVFGKSE